MQHSDAPLAVPAAPPTDALIDVSALDRAFREDTDALSVFRTALGEAQVRLKERFQAGTPAYLLVNQRAAAIDELLLRAWAQFRLDDETERAALVAVGGYGRSELHPGSDVDLLILLDAPATQAMAERIQAFVTFLWDIGLDVGHSVRTVAECVSEAEKDVTVATNMMEARRLKGPDALFQAMRRATGRDEIWPSRRFFEAKWQEQVSRHHRFHDTAYNLEPNVKEGPGGLRDIQMVGWVAKRHFGANTLHELVTHEFLTEAEHQALVEGQNFLWQIRFALHTLAGRREDRLLFHYQPEIAHRFGYRDREHNLAVEQLMKRYYRTVMELSRLNEMLLELFQEVILYADSAEEVVPLGIRFQARNGFLEVAHPGLFKRYPFALLEMFLVLQQHPEVQGVRASTIRLVRDHVHLIDDAFRCDVRARSLFLEIIRQPRGITHELHRMHRYGVLGAYLPAFGRIVGQMQYDLFHVYTVDEHSLFVVRNLRSFTVPERYHEFPLCSAIFQRLPKPELLYLGGLFHDIAKGRGGDHSELGARDALDFCLHHGLSQYDARFVAWLVSNHLLMSMTTQRQDIHDPDVVSQFVAKVGDRTHLDYLYLLTVADIRATNPKLWNDWKDTLLRDLYESSLRAMRRGAEKPVDRAELIAEKRERARKQLAPTLEAEHVNALWKGLGDDYFLRATSDEIAWHTAAILGSSAADLPLVLARRGRGVTEIFVYAPDQDFIFAATTMVLSRMGLTILDARIITSDSGMALDSYIVLEGAGNVPLDPSRERDVQETLKAQLRLPEKAVQAVNHLPKRQLKLRPIPTRVIFQPEPAKSRTLMEVVTNDRPGLLSLVGKALVDCGVRVQNAKVATIGERVEDFFLITDRENHPLSEQTTERLRNQILQTLDAG